MTKTIRREIVDALVSQMKNICKESNIFSNEDNVNLGVNIESTGIFSDPIGRPIEYNIIVSGVSEITYTNITQSGTPVIVSVTSGVSFPIDSTGISVVLDFNNNLVIGDNYDLRMNKSQNTIDSVYPWNKAGDTTNKPAVTIADFRERNNKLASGPDNDRVDRTLSLLVSIFIDSLTPDNSIRDIAGDVENELNRGSFDGSSELYQFAYDSDILGSDLFNDDSQENTAIITFEFEVKYRTLVKDSRVKG